MSQTQGSTPTFAVRPVRTIAEIQEAKRQEKLQSHASSHGVSGMLRPLKVSDDADAGKR